MRNILTIAITTLSVSILSGPVAAQTSPIDERTKKQVLAEIERYVTNDVRLKKFFLIVDPRTEQPLRLTFDHVHAGVERHAASYAACVDFNDVGGTVYDVDIVVGKAAHKMEVRDVLLHKIGGEAIEGKAKSGP